MKYPIRVLEIELKHIRENIEVYGQAHPSPINQRAVEVLKKSEQELITAINILKEVKTVEVEYKQFK